MSIAQLLTIYVGATLLAGTAAGLILRGRVAYSWSFLAYLLATATSALLIAWWPQRFLVFTVWSTKETVLTVLNITVALEIWQRNFCCFPRARVHVGLLLAGALLVTSVAAQMIPPGLHPYDALIGVHQPRLQAGLLSLLAILVSAAWWYRVPLHPLHRAILIGSAAHLTVDVSLMSFLGWQSASVGALQWTSALKSVSYTAAEVWWAWAAWRPLRAPSPIVSRLQPWAHSW